MRNEFHGVRRFEPEIEKVSDRKNLSAEYGDDSGTGYDRASREIYRHRVRKKRNHGHEKNFFRSTAAFLLGS